MARQTENDKNEKQRRKKQNVNKQKLIEKKQTFEFSNEKLKGTV